MGCDIHLVVQEKTSGGGWRTVPPPKELLEEDEDEKELGIPARWWDDRCYPAFAVLAGVRNYYQLIPVTKDLRGHPKDFDFGNDRDQLGDHSFHWLSLRELSDYPHWDDTFTVKGVVISKVYAAEFAGKAVHRLNEPPSAYCMGTTRRTIDEVDYLRMGSSAPVDEETYVRVRWNESVAFATGTLYTVLLPALRKYADERKLPYDWIRLVFGFDS